MLGGRGALHSVPCPALASWYLKQLRFCPAARGRWLLGLTLMAAAYQSPEKQGTSLTWGQTLLSGLGQDVLVRGAFLTALSTAHFSLLRTSVSSSIT